MDLSSPASQPSSKPLQYQLANGEIREEGGNDAEASGGASVHGLSSGCDLIHVQNNPPLKTALIIGFSLCYFHGMETTSTWIPHY